LSQSELTQRLATEHGIQLHRTTIRRILLAAGLEERQTAGSSARSQSAHVPEPLHRDTDAQLEITLSTVVPIGGPR